MYVIYDWKDYLNIWIGLNQLSIKHGEVEWVWKSAKSMGSGLNGSA